MCLPTIGAFSSCAVPLLQPVEDENVQEEHGERQGELHGEVRKVVGG